MEPSPDGYRPLPGSPFQQPGAETPQNVSNSIQDMAFAFPPPPSMINRQWQTTPMYHPVQTVVSPQMTPQTPSIVAGTSLHQDIQTFERMMAAIDMSPYYQQPDSRTLPTYFPPTVSAYATNNPYVDVRRRFQQRWPGTMPTDIGNNPSPVPSTITAEHSATSSKNRSLPPRPEVMRDRKLTPVRHDPPPTPRYESIPTPRPPPSCFRSAPQATQPNHFSLPPERHTRSAPIYMPQHHPPTHPTHHPPPPGHTWVNPLPVTEVQADGSVRVHHPPDLSSLSSASGSVSTSDSESIKATTRRIEQARDVKGLPHDAEGARVWALNLPWSIRGDDWCIPQSDGTIKHVTEVKTTTAATQRISNDLLTVIMTSAAKHKSHSTVEAVKSLLMEQVDGPNGDTLDGMQLIKEGKGIEIFQLRIKTGFRRGLGSEAMNELEQFLGATQRDRENVTAFARRVQDLYEQACSANKETLGTSLISRVIVLGLKRGSYRRLFEPWANKLQLGHSSLKLTSSLTEIVKKAGDILTASDFYQDGLLQQGAVPLKARAATSSPPSDTPTCKEIDEMIDHLRRPRTFFSNQLTDWVTANYSCGYCMTKTHHKLWECTQLRKAMAKQGYQMVPLPSHPPAPSSTAGGEASQQQPRRPPTDGKGRAANEETVEEAARKEEQASIANASGETLLVPPETIPELNSPVSEDEISTPDESDDAFAMFETITSDPNLSPADLESQQEQDLNGRRTVEIDGVDREVKPLSEKARLTFEDESITAKDLKWMAGETNSKSYRRSKDMQNRATNGLLLCERETAWISIDEQVHKSKLVTALERYLCPDSGATSNMNPYRDMFSEYQDIRHEKRYVRLGDENKRIPIVGKGTMVVEADGKVLAYANTYHVPDLSAILLSSRVHRRIPGCAFINDNDGCHLTFPNFVIEIDDSSDCTLPCQVVSTDLHADDYHFDSRRWPTASSSEEALRVCNQLMFRSMCRARLATLETANDANATKKRRRKKKGKSHDSSTNESTSDERRNQLKVPIPTPRPTTDEFPSIPVYSVPNTGHADVERIHSSDLKKMFGGRKLANWKVLEETGTGIHVIKDADDPPVIGEYTTIRRNKLGKLLQRPKHALDKVGMDIGYGAGTSPGGYKYSLMLVDATTRHSWVYGLKTKTAESVIDALWCFFIDAGGIPKRIQCDFDNSFVHGKVKKFLTTHQIKLTPAPPKRQASNGLVESNWKTAVAMARSLLTEAHLPRRYWFWALREAVLRMNIMPGRAILSEGTTLCTPHELFYGIKPDYRSLFQWGCIGYYRRTHDSGIKRGTFEEQSNAGIAIGRSNNTNGMIFLDPSTGRMITSSDYKLDPTAPITPHFPSVVYDGSIHPILLRGGTNDNKEAFPPGAKVTVRHNNEYLPAVIKSVPLKELEQYIIQFLDSDELFGVDSSEIKGDQEEYEMFAYDEDSEVTNVPPTAPDWLKDDTHVTLVHDDRRRRGFIQSTDKGWIFTQKTASGRTTYTLPMSDLPVTWDDRLTEGSLELGWQALARAYKVSAKELKLGVPPSFRRSMDRTYLDRKIWYESYFEELNGLKSMDTYVNISRQEYLTKYSHVQILPSMNVQTIKPDETGAPDRAKSRIVALGNYETSVWEKADTFAPVLRDESSRLMTSMSVGMGRREKQGDCKNAFVQSVLPADETVIVRPPPGCPISKPGELWLLRKTLYGLRRSPYHWYQNIKRIFLNMGLRISPHDPCVFTGQLRDDLPPIYVGLYVDDFKYFSLSDETEKIFENMMSTKCTVEFMGDVSWFLGCKYEWETLDDGRLTVSITQTAKAEEIIESHGMSDCNPVDSPYKSGLPIDKVEHDGIHPDDKSELVERYQSVVGGLMWLQRQTRPDITAVTHLLSRHSHNPSSGHYTSAKRVLAYLKGTLDRGIRFTQGGSPVCVNVAYPVRDGVYTDANWGPQDASHPKDGETIEIADAQSLLGHVVMRMGGPVCWGCIRETMSMSLSSCESEIYAANEGTKSVLTVRNLLSDFDYPEASQPSLLYNDNRGAVDWTKGCSVSKKLRHVNMRELMVRLHQRLNNIDVQHIAGKRNIADIFTKEEKDPGHYRSMSFTITTPRLLRHWNPLTGDTIDDDGNIIRPSSKNNAIALLPVECLVKSPTPPIQITAGAARGVLARACAQVFSISGCIYPY